MRSWTYRLRYYSLTLATGGLLAFSGCGLSDQQWATIWQSVMSAGLNTVVTNAITAAFGAATATG